MYRPRVVFDEPPGGPLWHNFVGTVPTSGLHRADSIPCRAAMVSAPANSTVDAADAAIYHFRNRIGSLEMGIPHEDWR